MFDSGLMTADIVRMAPLMAAPAFFALFGLAALGAPLLALVCRLGAEILRTQYLEVYARRLLRMGVSASVLSGLVALGSFALVFLRTDWAWDWARSEPAAPGLWLACAVGYMLALLLARVTAPPRYQRSDSPLLKTFVLAVLAVLLTWLSLSVAGDFALQAKAVLSAPVEGDMAVVLLQSARLSAPSLHMAASVGATLLLALTCASAMSCGYLVLRRDHDPFGRDAYAQALRLGARSALRCGILVAAAYPMTWMNLTDLLEGRPEAQAIKALLAFSLASLLAACGLWAVLSRSQRPGGGLALNGGLLLLWLSLTLLFSAALLYFYAT